MIFDWVKRVLRIALVCLLFILLMKNSGQPSLLLADQVRYFTRQVEFEYASWTIHAIYQKMAQAALGTDRYMDRGQQLKILNRYLEIIDQQSAVKDQLTQIYAAPDQTDNLSDSAQPLLLKQKALQTEMQHISLLAESIVQEQITAVLADTSLELLGQPLPPVQYHTTALPYALVISPRSVIRQDASISLLPDLTLDQIVNIEGQVESALDVSALVVPVGGIGVYPTMVMESTNFPWLAEVVSHEWIHNYLTLRPLGLLYDTSPQLRIINETTASIAGNELGQQMIARFYPSLVEPEEGPSTRETTPEPQEEEPVFDYRAVMHETRVTADGLLAEGKIQEAEAYMEEQRLLFIQNGYNIRVLNQAYFAFYGAYAETEGGAAGEDPVGAAVRELRAQSENLSAFVQKISWVTSFQKLQEILAPP
jgi:hypothetical protein